MYSNESHIHVALRVQNKKIEKVKQIWVYTVVEQIFQKIGQRYSISNLVRKHVLFCLHFQLLGQSLCRGGGIMQQPFF